MNSTIKLNMLFTNLTRNKQPKILGRGIGSGKGKTSGRGHKGQKARSGSAINGFEGGQQSIYTRLPKRGFKSSSLHKMKYSIINTGDIQYLIETKKIEEGAIINKDLLYQFHLIRSMNTKVKLLSKGHLDKKCIMHIASASESAKQAITASGGMIHLICKA
ncbi:50S ribosomal protein L15 [Wolbachia endosymbiont of Howardula sp.]|uniref:50S ribosomal protein L15 n=1 Tax=Wolbachia endosymbiont of Howardula sp. TaxID=2916816 RepID=UPI00217E031B|nr:50S ribosomal protein L15 [Wolbachia endosymbiont of Howardula sp.]UWI83153.1 50S ribosomal protein L15 [Wolbachia endosymbiont of Howardula sp.]